MSFGGEGDDDNIPEDDSGREASPQIGLNDNGDPKNPPIATPGALRPILDSELPTSKQLGGS